MSHQSQIRQPDRSHFRDEETNQQRQKDVPPQEVAEMAGGEAKYCERLLPVEFIKY